MLRTNATLSSSGIRTYNQYFFQGVAEVVSYLRLHEQGWKAIDYVEGSPALIVESESGQRHYLAVLSFFQRRDEALEQKQAYSLARVLNRIQSDYRIGLVIRKPLVQDFDAEAIRRAVEIWLRQSSGKIGSFAYYKNENVSIEIGISALRTAAQEDVVQFIQSSNKVSWTSGMKSPSLSVEGGFSPKVSFGCTVETVDSPGN